MIVPIPGNPRCYLDTVTGKEFAIPYMVEIRIKVPRYVNPDVLAERARQEATAGGATVVAESEVVKLGPPVLDDGTWTYLFAVSVTP